MKKTIIPIVALVLLSLSLGAQGQGQQRRPQAPPVPPKGSQVENVEITTRVGDVCQLVESIKLTAKSKKAIKGLKASDFDIVGNVGDGYFAKGGGQLQEFADDGIVMTKKGKTVTLTVTPFNKNGNNRRPWEVHCTNEDLNFSGADVDKTNIDIIDDCIHGTFTYAGLTREYMLYLPKDKKGNVIKNVPLLVWQIGGGEYDRDMMTVALANRCLVSLPTEGVPCATLVFALANPNYSYSASLDPEKIKLIDRNNALQMAFIDTLIEDGTVDGSKLFCSGASSGGGCTMRFMMQFPDRFKAAVPCCAMDPIIPIHQVKEKYDGQFADDLEKAFQGQVYKWNGSDMVLSDIDVKAFVKLPLFFVHAEADNTCKVISSKAYFEARRRLGAKDDKIQIFDEDYMMSYGVGGFISHFSWVPLLDDFSEGTAMDWLVRKMK